MFRKRCRLVVLVCAALFPSVAGASQLFDVNAQTTSSSPQSINVGSGNLPNLVKNLITNSDQFASLNNRDVSATLRYAGINAILIAKNSSDTSATVRIPSIGLTKTFNAANELPGQRRHPRLLDARRRDRRPLRDRRGPARGLRRRPGQWVHRAPGERPVVSQLLIAE
jgi:hypothetical protein